MAGDFDVLKKIYNAFDPFRPLEPSDPAYVDCQAVRGDEEIKVELGQNILLSERVTCQLYTGHRGAGKSTELLRLKQHLESNGFRVVYFAADQDDIDAEDAQYTDILLACTRNLLKALRGPEQNAVRQWFESRSGELRDLLGSDIQLDNLSMDAQISAFAKLTATVKASPQTRAKIRQMVEAHTVSLLEALNEFIAGAMAQTDQRDTSRLVVIADNLDRIVPVISGPESDEKSNHDRIFIDRSEQLKGLNCHVVYTVPISLVYSGRATDLRDNYGADPQALPMVMVRRPDGSVYGPGLAAMKEVIRARVYGTAGVNRDWSLAEKVFESQEVLDNLCLMSGGHLRNLMLMMQEATKRTAALPIGKKAVLRAITEARSTYRNTVYEQQWQLLAEVAQTKQVRNDLTYRELLFNRCILEYRELDGETGELQAWYDVHPVIRGIPEFRAATEVYLAELGAGEAV
ncbi:MAG: ATP-binding protein [Synechococcales cyanobacterium RM1_1_8]|nr:ATP-binding protein [Synechococcales cyanobacterium RM1_1_8]